MRTQPIGVDVIRVATADRYGSRHSEAGHGTVLQTTFPEPAHRLDPETVIAPKGH
ncbi:hypothetical protein HEP84_02610 [Streptomyces sp. RLB1-33]|nr:hypothetical protein [Streptomyces sp. RLB1-33]QIY68327.1 hypothetical protein HEP84_02610 [Streptomyces sp. RLB1-33]